VPAIVLICSTTVDALLDEELLEEEELLLEELELLLEELELLDEELDEFPPLPGFVGFDIASAC
jgi:hypothetical protein